MKLYNLQVKSCRDCPDSEIRINVWGCPHSGYETDTPDKFLPDCPLSDWPPNQVNSTVACKKDPRMCLSGDDNCFGDSVCPEFERR